MDLEARPPRAHRVSRLLTKCQCGNSVFEAALGIRSLEYHFFIKEARHSYRTTSLSKTHVSHARPLTLKTASRLCRSQVCTADVRLCCCISSRTIDDQISRIVGTADCPLVSLLPRLLLSSSLPYCSRSCLCWLLRLKDRELGERRRCLPFSCPFPVATMSFSAGTTPWTSVPGELPAKKTIDGLLSSSLATESSFIVKAPRLLELGSLDPSSLPPYHGPTFAVFPS